MDQVAAQLDSPPITWEHPTGVIPKTVIILGLGPTGQDWHDLHKRYDTGIEYDEVWSVNKAFRTQRCDLLFVMDDLIDEARKSPQYGRHLQAYNGSIVTSTADDPVAQRWPQAVAYPLREVLTFWGAHFHGRRYAKNEVQNSDAWPAGLANAGYLRNSIPYLLAYAGFIGVENIGMYGCDYNFHGQPGREDDKANTEYWIGALRFGLGVDVQVTPRSTLMRTNEPRQFYGFNGRQPF